MSEKIIDKDVADIEDYLKDKELESLPEAKSSVSYSLVSEGGFPLIFTVRCNDEGELLDLMGDLEGGFVKRGYQPDRKYGSVKVVSPAPVSDKSDVCPKCNAPLVEFTTKTGKSGVRCSTNVWNPETKTAEGCDYIKWNDTPTDEPATANQMQLLKDKNLWEEGMTKAQASKKIKSVLGK